MRGEHETELGDDAAQTCTLFDQVDGVAGLGNVQGGSLAGDASADDECGIDGVVFRHGDLSFDLVVDATLTHQ